MLRTRSVNRTVVIIRLIFGIRMIYHSGGGFIGLSRFCGGMSSTDRGSVYGRFFFNGFRHCLRQSFLYGIRAWVRVSVSG